MIIPALSKFSKNTQNQILLQQTLSLDKENRRINPFAGKEDRI
jgi:hypothetical protein